MGVVGHHHIPATTIDRLSFINLKDLFVLGTPHLSGEDRRMKGSSRPYAAEKVKRGCVKARAVDPFVARNLIYATYNSIMTRGLEDQWLCIVRGARIK